MLKHLTHDADGTEGPTAAASVPAEVTMSQEKFCFTIKKIK